MFIALQLAKCLYDLEKLSKLLKLSYFIKNLKRTMRIKNNNNTNEILGILPSRK